MSSPTPVTPVTPVTPQSTQPIQPTPKTTETSTITTHGTMPLLGGQTTVQVSLAHPGGPEPIPTINDQATQTLGSTPTATVTPPPVNASPNPPPGTPPINPIPVPEGGMTVTVTPATTTPVAPAATPVPTPATPAAGAPAPAPAVAPKPVPRLGAADSAAPRGINDIQAAVDTAAKDKSINCEMILWKVRNELEEKYPGQEVTITAQYERESNLPDGSKGPRKFGTYTSSHPHDTNLYYKAELTYTVTVKDPATGNDVNITMKREIKTNQTTVDGAKKALSLYKQAKVALATAKEGPNDAPTLNRRDNVPEKYKSVLPKDLNTAFNQSLVSGSSKKDQTGKTITTVKFGAKDEAEVEEKGDFILGLRGKRKAVAGEKPGFGEVHLSKTAARRYSEHVVDYSGLFNEIKERRITLDSLKEERQAKEKELEETKSPFFLERSFTQWSKGKVNPSYQEFLDLGRMINALDGSATITSDEENNMSPTALQYKANHEKLKKARAELATAKTTMGPKVDEYRTLLQSLQYVQDPAGERIEIKDQAETSGKRALNPAEKLLYDALVRLVPGANNYGIGLVDQLDLLTRYFDKEITARETTIKDLGTAQTTTVSTIRRNYTSQMLELKKQNYELGNILAKYSALDKRSREILNANNPDPIDAATAKEIQTYIESSKILEKLKEEITENQAMIDAFADAIEPEVLQAHP